ncbi:heme peroxidase [Xylariales sp. PMI_506]|nr:heme peroxidase [Xylariales sp. PMI_506]
MQVHLILASALMGTVAAVAMWDHSIQMESPNNICPPVWIDVAAELRTIFEDDSGLPTDLARAAVRVSFHDCFPGACDGSIILAGECFDRIENVQMVGICGILGDIATKYGVGVADLVQLSTALGIVSTLGPAVSFKVGRKDSNIPNPPGQLPAPDADAETLVRQFASRGLTALDLVALVGSHSSAKNLAGQALDSTVDVWDTLFYSETLDRTAPASIPADINLSQDPLTAANWKEFAVGSLQVWSDAFVPAMEKVHAIGSDLDNLIDCSSIVTDTFPAIQRIHSFNVSGDPYR